jgi:hypothetical protein
MESAPRGKVTRYPPEKRGSGQIESVDTYCVPAVERRDPKNGRAVAMARPGLTHVGIQNLKFAPNRMVVPLCVLL